MLHVLGPGKVGSEPIAMKFKKMQQSCFLRGLLEVRAGQFMSWSTIGLGMASWRKCQCLGRAGRGYVRLLVVEKLKAVMKAWSCANRS